MKTVGNLTITTPSDREIRMTRVFDAPRGLVFDAYTQPELLKQSLGVFGGWTLAVCEVQVPDGDRRGGEFRRARGAAGDSGVRGHGSQRGAATHDARRREEDDRVDDGECASRQPAAQHR
jgi:uncharacterized protein YndB with AHSA1/START domain